MASLNDQFQRAMEARAGARQPSSVRGAMDRYGWSTRDVAQRLGVSERTARRWRQQDHIPERRRGDWRRETVNAARGRQRARMERGGVASMSAAGQYQVSKSRYRTGPNSRVRTSQAKIPAAAMRAYFAALDRGDAQAADDALNGALADAYGASDLHMTDVEDVNFTI